jgi:hypothetical protein
MFVLQLNLILRKTLPLLNQKFISLNHDGNHIQVVKVSLKANRVTTATDIIIISE